MKNALATGIFLFLLSARAVGQDPNQVSILHNYTVDSLLLDFTVPDLPAFKALGTNPSDILRPSDVQKFAVSLNPFFSNGNAVIPKAFALEFAPWKIASKNWTIKQYRDDAVKRLLYNSSFSLGTVQESTESPQTKLALGYRVKLLGKEADLLTSKKLPALYSLNDDEKDRKVRSQDYWIKTRHIARAKYLASDSMQLVFDKHYKDSVSKPLVAGAIRKFKQDSWNASRLDLALAVVGASSDSLAENVKYQSFSVWLTGALRTGRASQLLLGVFYNNAEKTRPSYTFNSRFFVGNSDLRAYAEYQVKRDGTADKVMGLVNLGAEFRFSKVFWVDFYGGVESLYEMGGSSRFKTSLNLKYSINK